MKKSIPLLLLLVLTLALISCSDSELTPTTPTTNYSFSEILDKDEEIIRSIYAIPKGEIICNAMLIDSLIEENKGEMLACKIDTDCLPAGNGCGISNDLTATNKTFAPLYDYLKDVASACMECAPRSILGEFTNVRCENYQCVADFVAK